MFSLALVRLPRSFIRAIAINSIYNECMDSPIPRDSLRTNIFELAPHCFDSRMNLVVSILAFVSHISFVDIYIINDRFSTNCVLYLNSTIWRHHPALDVTIGANHVM